MAKTKIPINHSARIFMISVAGMKCDFFKSTGAVIKSLIPSLGRFLHECSHRGDEENDGGTKQGEKERKPC